MMETVCNGGEAKTSPEKLHSHIHFIYSPCCRRNRIAMGTYDQGEEYRLTLRQRCLSC
jgi:hypothetical protein